MRNKDYRTGSAREDWNLRAKEDYRHAIASYTRGDEMEAEFRRAGETDAETIALLLGDNDTSEWRALEYGCGVGRLMEPLSKRFREVHGVDISDEMVRIGRERAGARPDLAFHVLENGRLPLPSSSFDLVYSMHVFQHMPKRAFAGILPEIARVLRPGGTFLFHLMAPNSFRRRAQAILGVDQLSLRHAIERLSGANRGSPETWRRRYYTLSKRAARAT